MEHMTWWAYVQQAAAESNANIARRIGVTPSSISRWGRGSLPDPEQAAAFARAYGRPVLEAFIAAGFLTAEEAGEKPSAPPSLASLGDDELLEEIRRRMQGGSSDGRQPEAKKSPDGGRGGGSNVRRLNPKRQRMLEDAQEMEKAAYMGETADDDKDDDL